VQFLSYGFVFVLFQELCYNIGPWSGDKAFESHRHHIRAKFPPVVEVYFLKTIIFVVKRPNNPTGVFFARTLSMGDDHFLCIFTLVIGIVS